MLDTTTKQKINTLRDILVGKVSDPKSQVEQITIALFYKFMEDMDNELINDLGIEAKFFSGEYAKYSWKKLFAPSLGGEDMLSLYRDAVEKMEENPNIPSAFRDIFKRAYLPYNDPATLRMFLKVVDDGFHYSHSEMLGDAFEYLLSILGTQGDAGQFRTPRHIIDFVAACVNPQKGDVICDPACGTAGFVIAAYKHILKQNTKNTLGDLLSAEDRKKLSQNLIGLDIDPMMVKLALANMYLHGFQDPHIYEYDSLTSEDKWDDTYDVVLANPPFMTPKGGIRPHKRFTTQAIKAEVLFVDLIASHLTANGRAGVIVPNGIVATTQNAYKKLRKLLIDDSLIAVISLPAGVFLPYSGVKTSILILDKALSKKSDSILFIKVENDGFDLGAQRRKINKNDLPNALKCINNYKINLNDNLKLNFDINKLDCLIVKKQIILSNPNVILSGDRYKKTKISHSNFPIIPLGNVAEINTGNSAPQEERYFKNGTIPFIRTSDVGKVHFSSNLTEFRDYINEDCLKEKRLKVFKRNTILFPKSGASTYLNHRVLMGVDGCVASHLSTIYADEKKINSIFLLYILTKIDAKELTEGDYPSLKIIDIKNLQIPLPPIKIQEQIVVEIEGYQKIIDGAKMVVDNYKPTISVKPEWEMVELGSVCEINPKKNEVKNLGNLEVSFLPMAELNENEMFFKAKDTRVLKDVYSGYTYFKENDVLLAKVTPCFENGKAGLAKNLINGIGFGSSEYYVLRANEKLIRKELIYYYINSNDFLIRGKTNMSGTSGLQRLYKDFVSEYLIGLPPMEEQEAIVKQIEIEQKIVDANKQLIEIYEQKIKDRIAQVWGEG